MRSTTVVGSRPQSPPSTTASSACPIDSRISQPLVSGSVSPGRIKRGRDHRFAQFGEQCLRHRMRRNAHADGEFLRVHHPAGDVAKGRQDERVRTRRDRPKQPEGRVVHLDELADLGEVAAHKREVVPGVEVTEPPDAIEAVGVVERTAERVARVGGVGDQTARAQDPDHARDQPWLRIDRVDVDVGDHARSSSCRNTRRASGRPGAPALTARAIHAANAKRCPQWADTSAMPGCPACLRRPQGGGAARDSNEAGPVRVPPRVLSGVGHRHRCR